MWQMPGKIKKLSALGDCSIPKNYFLDFLTMKPCLWPMSKKCSQKFLKLFPLDTTTHLAAPNWQDIWMETRKFPISCCIHRLVEWAQHFRNSKTFGKTYFRVAWNNICILICILNTRSFHFFLSFILKCSKILNYWGTGCLLQKLATRCKSVTGITKWAIRNKSCQDLIFRKSLKNSVMEEKWTSWRTRTMPSLRM